jgi:hypothetical protein
MKTGYRIAGVVFAALGAQLIDSGYYGYALIAALASIDMILCAHRES